MTQGFEFVEIVDHHHVGHNAVGRRGCAPAQRGEHNFLRGTGGLTCILGEFRSFSAAHPVRHFDFFEVDFQTELAQLASDVLQGSFGL